ncbi:hypothetical protein [Streptomyces mirabilis]|uniref:hypothetical protein n=1 Tax=Streptomyces mirabilis TaxID=68239 RepID=UPI0036B7BD17
MSTLADQAISTRRLDLLPLHVAHDEEMAVVLSGPAHGEPMRWSVDLRSCDQRIERPA